MSWFIEINVIERDKYGNQMKNVRCIVQISNVHIQETQMYRCVKCEVSNTGISGFIDRNATNIDVKEQYGYKI